MFAVSKCPKCEAMSFKVVTQEPGGSNFKINFVQCSACQTPIGTMDYFNTGAQLEKQKTEIDQMHQRLKNMESTLHQIAHRLNSIR